MGRLNYNHFVKQFQPIIVFDSRETFFPCDFDFYLSNAVDLNCERALLTTQTLYSLPDPKNSVIQCMNNECLLGYHKDQDLNTTPFYTTTRLIENRTKLLIQYILFFPFRGHAYICGCLPWYYQEGEVQFQFIHLVVDLQSEQIDKILVDGKELNCVEYYNEHRPLLYASCYTHNLYARSGEYGNFFVTESCDGLGKVLNSEIIETLDEHTLWNRFTGLLGPNNCTTPYYDSRWLLKETLEKDVVAEKPLE